MSRTDLLNLLKEMLNHTLREPLSMEVEIGHVCSTLDFISYVRYVEHTALLLVETDIEYHTRATCILDSSSKPLRGVCTVHILLIGN